MEFDRLESKTISINKVRRIKKDFKLVTKIRKKSNSRMGFINSREHSVVPNLVRRNFKDVSNVVHSIDITEFRTRSNQKSYLFAVKKLLTKEIVAFETSSRPSMELVMGPMKKYLRSLSDKTRSKMIVHSDQGVHFTSYEFRELLLEFGVRQSMSRKGKCLDNAPIESFFGHLKDELEYKNFRTQEDLRRALKQYMNYYNNGRPQWDLKQKTPAEAGVRFSLVF